MAYIAYAFPTQLYGRLVGISEIFSTLAGIVIVPIAKSIIFSVKARKLRIFLQSQRYEI